MAKSELSGTVLSFRQSKHRQDSYQTIVRVDEQVDPYSLVGARVVWLRADGFQIRGRIVARHGTVGAVRVRWSRGFPPQALGSAVKIHAGIPAGRAASAERSKEDEAAAAPLRKRAARRRASP
jgi:ribosomal protein L35AE/L33A